MNIESTSNISDDQKYNRLCQILKNYEDDEKSQKLIAQAYTQVIPRTLSRIMGEEIINSLKSQEIMKILSCYPQYPDILAKFVCFMLLDESQEKNPFLMAELNSWLHQHYESSDDLLKQIREILDNYQPHLALAISKGNEEKYSGKYIAEVWVIENVDDQCNSNIVPYWQPLKIEGRLVYRFTTQKPTKKGLIKILQNALQSFHARQNERIIKQIQTFFPSDLMCNYPIDSYEISVDKKKKIKIGKRYQIVMRYTERLKEQGDSFCLKKWHNKAEQIKLNICANELFNPADNENFESLENQFLIQDEEEKNNQVIAVKRTTGFQGTQKEKDFLTLLFNCSIPVALWVRQEIQDIETQMETFWEEKQLKDIPQQVKLKRMKASSENCIGQHLCLLWDFPHFLPPKHKRSHSTQIVDESKL